MQKQHLMMSTSINTNVMTRFLLLISCLFYGIHAFSQSYPFQQQRLSDDKRIDLLLDMLTIDEKISLLTTNLGVPRLGIPSLATYEGLHGLALGGPAMNNGRKTIDGKEVPNDLPTTMFPQSYGLGCTWNPEALRRMGDIEAEEARYYSRHPRARRKGLVVYAPNADLARDPRWGRTEESFGEDPLLTAALSVALIRGLQGDDPRYWKTAALMKHFLANSNEDGRDSTSSNFSERLFREYYSYPFYKGFTQGGSRAVMASYNAWNGTPMCINPCLDEIVRKEWGNNGIICTDGYALTLLIEAHKAFSTRAEGAAAIVKASVGQILDRSRDEIREALQRQLLTEEDIDRAIRGNLFVALKLGMLDGSDTRNPYASIGNDTLHAPCDREEVKAFVRDITAQSIVLLKNDRQLLPIRPSQIRTIAVTGPYADKIVQDWYSGTPPYSVTILQGIREAAKPLGIEVIYAPDNRMGRAVEAARKADLVIACVGNHPYGTRADWKFCPVASDGREAVDRLSLNLPDEEFLQLLHQTNPNTVLALVSSFPYSINWSNEHLPAILHLTHCSQEQGHALADVLFGKTSPAGRTTQTWVTDQRHLPPIMDYDITHGRTYMYSPYKPLYPFGYGLSYTHFCYGEPQISPCIKGTYTLTIPVTNSGDTDSDEVVQVYLKANTTDPQMPRKALKAFQRLPIPAGATVNVSLKIDDQDLSFWDETRHQFVPIQRPFTLLIGASSEDIRKEIVVEK